MGRKSVKGRITKDMLIDELIREYPEVCEVLERFDLPCTECALAPTSTVENASQMHNIPLKELLRELNKAISNKDNNK